MTDTTTLADYADQARRELNARRGSRYAWGWGGPFDCWYARFESAMTDAAQKSPSAREFLRLHRQGARIDYINGEHMCNLLDAAAAECIVG